MGANLWRSGRMSCGRTFAGWAFGSVSGGHGPLCKGCTVVCARQRPCGAANLRLPRSHGRDGMAAKLDKAIKRELDLDGESYTVTISPEGVRIVPKGRRKGHEITWQTILSGDAELTQQLKISLDALSQPDDGAGR